MADPQALDDRFRLEALNATGFNQPVPNEGLDRIARIAAAMLDAPVSLVSLVEDERQVFAGLEGLGGPFGEARQTPLTHSFCQLVVTSGQPLIVTDTTRDARVEGNAAISDLNVIAYCGVPLVTAGGWRVGSLCVIDHEVRDWSEEQLATLTDLAEVVGTELRLRETTQELEAALERETSRRGAAETLALLTTRLAPLLSAPEIVSQVNAHVTQHGLAHVVSLGLLIDGALQLFHGDSLDSAIAKEFTSIPLDAALPMSIAAREAAPVIVRNLEDAKAIEGLSELMRDTGYRSAAAFPLRALDGETVGVLSAARTDDIPLPVERLDDVARVVALALDRTSRHEREARQARILQTALVPSILVEAPHLEISTRYAAASNEASVGGDWYDLLDLGEGRYLVVVGDVAGHDIAAARTVARARHAIGALASMGLPPDEILRFADGYVGGHGKAMATCGVGLLDTAMGRATFASAGHPPPLLVRDGSPNFLDIVPGPPLVGLGGGPYAATFDVQPSDVLVLYTDGLIERRGESIDDGLERLRRTAEKVDFTDLAHAGDDLLAISVRDDDVALMMIRIR